MSTGELVFCLIVMIGLFVPLALMMVKASRVQWQGHREIMREMDRDLERFSRRSGIALAVAADVEYSTLSQEEKDWLEEQAKLLAPDVESDLDKKLDEVKTLMGKMTNTENKEVADGRKEEGSKDPFHEWVAAAVRAEGVRLRGDVHADRTEADQAHTKLLRAERSLSVAEANGLCDCSPERIRNGWGQVVSVFHQEECRTWKHRGLY